jgi:hypothetical protein
LAAALISAAPPMSMFSIASSGLTPRADATRSNG